MRIAYADPPYVGQSRKHYGGAEVNQRLLIAHLCDEFPDGWALSCSTPSLRQLLPWCPDDVRIGAWVKPFHVFKRGVRPAYAWEPVLFRGGRNNHPEIPVKGGTATTPRDWVSANITLRRGCAGAKPAAFCYWLFDLLNLRGDDELVDVFPGSGAVDEAWARYKERFVFEAFGEPVSGLRGTESREEPDMSTRDKDSSESSSTSSVDSVRPLAARVQADMSFSGVRVIESPYLEEDGEPYTVRRTWRERLFSRPWRPFVTTRVVIPRVPYRGAVHLNATTLVMHPQTLRQLRETLEKSR